MTDAARTRPRASLALLPSRITDRHVVDQLLRGDGMTRAEIAAATGISKPTVSESVRRLELDGVVAAAGAAPSGRRGPAGVALPAPRRTSASRSRSRAGRTAWWPSSSTSGGPCCGASSGTRPSPVTAAELDPLLRRPRRARRPPTPPGTRTGVLALAGRAGRPGSGRLVHLPHSPFLVDELDPRALLAPLRRRGDRGRQRRELGRARRARRRGGASAWTTSATSTSGTASGARSSRPGELVRGHAGLAGEPAHMLTVGPGGRAMQLVECFGELGLLRPASDTIDVGAVRGRARRVGSADDRRRGDAVVEAVAGRARLGRGPAQPGGRRRRRALGRRARLPRRPGRACGPAGGPADPAPRRGPRPGSAPARRHGPPSSRRSVNGSSPGRHRRRPTAELGPASADH